MTKDEFNKLNIGDLLVCSNLKNIWQITEVIDIAPSYRVKKLTGYPTYSIAWVESYWELYEHVTREDKMFDRLLSPEL